MLDVVDKQMADELSKPHPNEWFEVVVNLNVKLNPSVAIVDIETTGLTPDCSDIVTLGIIYDNKMMILQRCGTDCRAFKMEVHRRLQYVKAWGKTTTFFAYNRGFEKEFLGDGYEWAELMPFRIKKDECIKFVHYHFGEGKEVVRWWQNYLASSKHEYLVNIVRHNSQCLLKELAIFLVSTSNYRAGE